MHQVLCEAGKYANGNLQMLKSAFLEETFSHTRMFEWFAL
jgi:hypothetical protein